jgi:hypothetical protein
VHYSFYGTSMEYDRGITIAVVTAFVPSFWAAWRKNLGMALLWPRCVPDDWREENAIITAWCGAIPLPVMGTITIVCACWC